ncbi:Pro-resilin [Amphibalanus amphitrite]|uniref:Pro-resilin n=1 Tax=Amphibalanus amphitrite TaxID=1232801 RepID=A0A6A4VTI7_AMPAM|nr:Pro-resilin [Amphibalanus amphitrite]
MSSLGRRGRPSTRCCPLKMRVILLAALLASVARAQINPGNQFFSGPLAPAPLTPLGQPPPDGVAQYTYGYKTEDPAEAAYSEQNEQRNGNAVTGFYSTLLPDGRVQVVNYVADENGYRATVSYQTPDGIPLPSPQQAPGAPPPRAEPRQPTFLFSGPLPPLTADLGPGFGRRVDSGAPLGFAGPAKREDHSWSHKTGSPAGPASRSGDDEAAAPAGHVVTSSAQFSARQGRLSRRPQARSAAVRAPRQSGAFGAGPSEPAAADPSHPLAQFIHSPLHRFSPQFGEWNPMRIRT